MKMDFKPAIEGKYLKLYDKFKRGDVIYWDNNFNSEEKGYYQIIDDTLKKENLYLCIKKA